MSNKIRLAFPSRLTFAGPVFIVAAALLWSLDAIVRGDLRSIPPAFLVTLEHFFGLIPLLPFLWMFRKNILQAPREAKISIVVTSLISGLLGTVFYTAALSQVQFVPFSVVVLMQQLQPIFAVGLAALLLKEKISRTFLMYGGFALVGAYLINFPELIPNLSTTSGQAQVLAALLALCAAMAWGFGTVFSKFSLGSIDYRAATAVRFLITFIAGIVLSIALRQTVPLAMITGQQILMLIVIALTSGMVALLIYYRGLSKTEAKVSTFAELVWPVSAFLIDVIFRGNIFTPTQLIGAALLVFTIWHISRLNKSK